MFCRGCPVRAAISPASADVWNHRADFICRYLRAQFRRWLGVVRFCGHDPLLLIHTTSCPTSATAIPTFTAAITIHSLHHPATQSASAPSQTLQSQSAPCCPPPPSPPPHPLVPLHASHSHYLHTLRVPSHQINMFRLPFPPALLPNRKNITPPPSLSQAPHSTA